MENMLNIITISIIYSILIFILLVFILVIYIRQNMLKNHIDNELSNLKKVAIQQQANMNRLIVKYLKGEEVKENDEV